MNETIEEHLGSWLGTGPAKAATTIDFLDTQEGRVCILTPDHLQRSVRGAVLAPGDPDRMFV